MALVEAYTGIVNGLKAAKVMAEGILAVNAKQRDASHNRQLAELDNKLAEILKALTENMVEVSLLTMENVELKQKLNDKDDLSRLRQEEDYLTDPNVTGAVFCMKCRYDKRKLSTMTEQDGTGKYKTGKKYKCNDCGHVAGTYNPPPSPGPVVVQNRSPFDNLYGRRR